MPDYNLAVSILSGLATGLGGLLALAAGRAGAGVMPALLGMSAGIGFTVIFFDLMPGAVRAGSWTAAAGGLAAGIVLGKAADLVFPHLHASGSRGAYRPAPAGAGGNLLKTGYLFALGVAMHNLPEGLAVGAGLEAGKELGLLLAAAIGLHNVPEGMALCGVIILGGTGRAAALAVSAGAGLMLPLGTVLAGVWIAAIPGMFSFILALGAGAMLYVIVNELVPESRRMHPAQAGRGMAAGALISLAISLFL
ncbi:MAG: ZIP family metal transporter [Peptococcaceae bacterium]|nr:ZIP family metal transporter [Peptococcaceae bacterium]